MDGLEADVSRLSQACAMWQSDYQQALDARRKAEAALAEAQAELARWKMCENCGTPLTGPGICDQAITEREKGLELMHEQTLTRAEAAEAALVALRQQLSVFATHTRQCASMQPPIWEYTGGFRYAQAPSPKETARLVSGPGPCDCGLDALLAAVETPETTP